MTDEIPEPMTQLAEGANQLHECYLAWKAAGFREDQALYLCAQMITAAIPRAEDDGGESQ